jgi:Lhr-like helicase
MPLAAFHPLITDWFQSHIGEPANAQGQVWRAIQSGSDAQIAGRPL